MPRCGALARCNNYMYNVQLLCTSRFRDVFLLSVSQGESSVAGELQSSGFEERGASFAMAHMPSTDCPSEDLIERPIELE